MEKTQNSCLACCASYYISFTGFPSFTASTAVFHALITVKISSLPQLTLSKPTNKNPLYTTLENVLGSLGYFSITEVEINSGLGHSCKYAL